MWIFPGQGGQRSGMLKEVPQEMIQRVKELTGVQLQDDEKAYHDSIQIQLGILMLQLFSIRQLQSIKQKPDAVAGHSLGIFAAAVASGVISEDDAIKIVYIRSMKMQESYPTGYGMGAIVGLTRKEVSNLVSQVNNNDQPVFTSNQNSELQTVISGSIVGIKKVLTLAKENSAQKTVLLKVPVPSHSPLMQKVADVLEKELANIELQNPQCTYLANYNGHAIRKVDGIKYDMINNLTHPVYWDTMMDVASELGIDTTLEIKPGQTFTKLVKSKFPDFRTITMNSMNLDDIEFLLEKWKRG
ncbi:ACP S-malonyltransferase [Companilactobacillus alimentarius]|uniref:ACP S-malonyltransferase n=1 Tax=Companilactobacillus alimentarius TaxID=1602 RepID=UPI0006F0A4EF|nr:acyltransferase domain-containing protein [Companilactobacillus alimentarius]KRK78440.1 acyl transferase region [Companilactobacillus alimentarius DSM 20249]MDT6953461.1 acyltransferase domain-containing protein [Companilactobacillus alimentarius]